MAENTNTTATITEPVELVYWNKLRGAVHPLV